VGFVKNSKCGVFAISVSMEMSVVWVQNVGFGHVSAVAVFIYAGFHFVP